MQLGIGRMIAAILIQEGTILQVSTPRPLTYLRFLRKSAERQSAWRRKLSLVKHRLAGQEDGTLPIPITEAAQEAEVLAAVVGMQDILARAE